jgi:hypothetical protein
LFVVCQISFGTVNAKLDALKQHSLLLRFRGQLIESRSIDFLFCFIRNVVIVRLRIVDRFAETSQPLPPIPMDCVGQHVLLNPDQFDASTGTCDLSIRRCFAVCVFTISLLQRCWRRY